MKSMMKTPSKLDKKTKQKVDREVLDIIMFHIRVLKMELNKQNINLATTMFVEGIKYWEEKKNDHPIHN